MEPARKNNFDFSRLLFALFVVITHSYALTGNDQIDFLFQATSGKMSLSYIGVRGFFVISGYLILQSLTRSANVIDYMWKRILRLFPGLIVMLIFTICLVPCVYEETRIQLLDNSTYLTYLPNNLKLYTPQFTIDGVFESNPFRSSVNGSLWTIQYEFSLYLILIFLFTVRKNLIFTRIIVAGAFTALLFGNTLFYDNLKIYNENLLDFGYFFFSGCLFSAFSISEIINKKIFILASLVVLILSIPTAMFSITKLIAIPILVILTSASSTKYINEIGSKIGDLSYGIYIYAFPIQQTIVYFSKCNTLQLILASIIITSIIASFSWHFIEKKALRYKSIFARLRI